MKPVRQVAAARIAARTPAEGRARAARIVAQVSANGSSLDGLLAELSGNPQQRGLTRTLVYGTVRWQLRLEAVLEQLATRSPNSLHPEVRALLLLGLYQLLHSDIAPHAAVAETVEAVRVLKQPQAAGFVNAVLRRAQRDAAAIAAEVDRSVAVRTAHPAWLVAQLEQDWPAEECARILDANNGHPPMWLRVNARRTSVSDYRQRLAEGGLASEPSPYAPQALRLLTPVDVQALPGFAQGDVSVQDAAAQLAAHLLAPNAADRVLDACAAPGGKTGHLLELAPLAELCAVDIAPARLAKVRDNLQRLSLNAVLKAGDMLAPTWWDGRPFGRILLDVPCSATGVIRRHPDIKLLRRATDIAELASRQLQMLHAAWSMLAPGGRLLYASCSALRAETGAVVADFLAVHREVADITCAVAQALNLPFSTDAGSTNPGLTNPGLRIPAGAAQMDGFYYACLQKPTA
jgi:16S rRNA (cytosine967-C5)-methyltransferase